MFHHSILCRVAATFAGRRPRCWTPCPAFFLVLVAGCSGTGVEGPDRPREDLEDLLSDVESAREDGRRGEAAMRDVDRLVNRYPGDPDILFASAALSAERGDREIARHTLDEALRHRAYFPEAAVLRAELALRDGNVRYARRLLDEQIRGTPDHAALREARAAVFFLERDPIAAERELRRARDLGAPTWRVAYHLGLVAEDDGRTEEARALYQECLEAREDFAPARSRLRGLDLPDGGAGGPGDPGGP